MTRTLLLAAGLLALATPAVAQTGYGQPSPGQYRAEQRATATLNQRGAAVDDGRDDAAPDEPRLGYGDYDREPARDDRYADDRGADERDPAGNRQARADYRRRTVEHRADLARWRERVAACNDGVRSACAGYEQRYGSYARGRYADPRDGYAAPDDGGRYAGRYDADRAVPDDGARYDDRYEPRGRDEGEDQDAPYRR